MSRAWRAASGAARGLQAKRTADRHVLLAEIERLRQREHDLLGREAFLVAAFESMDVGVIAIDTDGTPVIWNARARYSVEHDAADIHAADWSAIHHVRGSDGEPVATEQLPIYRAVRGERVSGEEFDTLVAGVNRRLSVNAGPILLPDGTTVGAISTSADISKLHTRERELARANADLDAIATATQQVLNGDDARQAVVNAALEVSDALSVMMFEPSRPTSNTLVEVAQAGLRLGDFEVHRDDSTHTAKAFRTGRVVFVVDLQVDAEGGENAGMAIIELATGADAKPRSMIAVPVMRDGIPRGVISVVLTTPVSTSNLRLLGLLELLAADAALAISREDTARELSRLASTDPLTGLANRRSWDERLEDEIERARRTELPLTVVMLDLDHFKSYNDTRGHQAGDELLAAGAKSWLSVLRSGDTLARLGGEEFGVLLPGCPVHAVPALVERLIKALPDGQTCSAGVAQWAGEVPAHTIARADAALYEAKRSGRATFRVATTEVNTELPSPRPASTG